MAHSFDVEMRRGGDEGTQDLKPRETRTGAQVMDLCSCQITWKNG